MGGGGKSSARPSSGAISVTAPKNARGPHVQFARGLIKHFDRAEFDPYQAIYFLVHNASEGVIRNILLFFNAFLDVLVERFDNDMSGSNAEYEAAVVAKRVQDALETFK